jgi:hypothetical protein
MKRPLAWVATVLSLLVLAAPALAQKPAATPAPAAKTAAAPIPPAKAAAIQGLFKSMKLQEEVQAMPEAMIASEISRNPGLTPFQDVMTNWLKKYMTWQAMSPELTRLYADTFSEAEIKEMAGFYGTPTGQKALQKMPELMQRSAMIGAQLGQAHSDELKKIMEARSEELKKQEEKAAAAKAPAGGTKPPAAKPAAPTKKP